MTLKLLLNAVDNIWKKALGHSFDVPPSTQFVFNFSYLVLNVYSGHSKIRH